MATLQIRKLSEKVWKHIPSDASNFIISKLYAKTDGNTFKIIEDSGSNRKEYDYTNITVYDDSIGFGSPETFASSQALMLRLEALKYVGFNRDGDVPTSIDEAPIDGLIYGRKNASWIEVTGGTAIPLSSTTISGTVKTNSFEADPILYTKAEVDALLASLPSAVDLFPIKYLYQATGAGIASVGTNLLNFSGGTQTDTTTGTPSTQLSYRKITSATTAGSSIYCRESSFNRAIQDRGYYLFERIKISDASLISDVRFFHGMRSLGGAGNVDISTETVPLIGFACDGADTEIQLMYRGDSGAVTKIPLGASFPKPSATGEYLMSLTRLPNSNTTDYYIKDFLTGATASGSVTHNPLTLTMTNSRNNNTSAIACAFEIQRIILNVSEDVL